MEIVLPGTAVSRLTVSVGIALYPDHGEDVDTVLQAADRALYDAKRSGRDQVVVTAE
jgi:diguanylate cyclase (GGDEF)-like protein